MTADLDRLPAFFMRRSRRAREGLRDFLARLNSASPRKGERHLPSTNSNIVPLSHGQRRKRLLIILSLICAVSGFALMGEGLWIKAKAVVAQILLERAFDQSIASGKPVKPWAWADTWPVARIAVPRLDVSAIALASGSGQALAFGPGHLDRTPEPGERGTVVFAAHRDTHFRFLGDLKVGDEIKVTRSDGIAFTYEMTGSEIVRWDQSHIDAHAHGYYLALATCWPLDATLHGPWRYIVHAKLK